MTKQELIESMKHLSDDAIIAGNHQTVVLYSKDKNNVCRRFAEIVWKGED